MREILFRGKRMDNGEWVVGNYVYRPKLKGERYIVTYNAAGSNMWFLVDPATIGQYTGLTDKNVKRIFEGDYLDGFEYPFYRAEDDIHNYYAEVVWFDDPPAFGLYTIMYLDANVRGISEGNADYMADFEPHNWEVIGNIHDNPERLKGGKS